MDRPLSLLDERVRRTYEAGRRAHPGILLDLERFAAPARQALPRSGNADYFLAVACDQGTPGAWERLQDCYARPLRGLLRRRGASRHEVEQLLDDVWGRLASPPPRGGGRTRIGSYDGHGPLLAWLLTVAWRRLVDVWRERAGLVPLDTDPLASRRGLGDPLLQVEDDETAELVGAALERAWAALTDRELQVVVLKYRHLLPQREIARVLRVSSSRVTRLLQSAARRLRRAVASRYELRAHVASADSNHDALLLILQRMLTQTDATMPGTGRQGR